MQKNTTLTIVFLMIICIYNILIEKFFLPNIHNIYTYILNPCVWIIFSVLLTFLVGKQFENNKIKKDIKMYAAIAVLVYIIVNLISGLFITFGKNPYSRNIVSFFINIWAFGTIIIAKEYIRNKLINNVYQKDKIKIAILISIIYIIIDFGIKKIVDSQITTYFVVNNFFQIIIPLTCKNILFSYIAIYSDWIASIIYELGVQSFSWISPILPNAPWVMTTIFESVIPIILILYIRFEKSKNDRFRTKEKIKNSEPKSIILFTICLILAIWFALGLFPIKPVAIATGSMEKELYMGDVAILKKCNANDVEVGDIIEYQMEGYTVIHRIIQKNQKNGRFVFITKGDNNNAEDRDPVTEEQLIGKVIFKIKYLGYPAIILHNWQVQQEVEVETGR